MRDRYGFSFWLKWILWFAGSFVMAAAFWTVILTAIFGRLEGEEVTLAWAVAVFGSWFLLVIPFMRKKEQIWKRLNDDQEKAVDTWFFGMVVFIALLVISALGWSLAFKERLQTSGLDPVWSKAVFGSWLAALVPLLVFFYRQADRLFKEAARRQNQKPLFRSVTIEREKRLLSPAFAEKLKAQPPTLKNGHLISALLKDGRKIGHLFILNFNEIVGIYDAPFDFTAQDILEIKPAGHFPSEESKWLRLDGRI